MDTDCQTTRASGEIITEESPLPTFIEFYVGRSTRADRLE